MSVRTKTLLIIISTIVVAVSVLYISSKLIILRSFDKLEREKTSHEVNQGGDALQDDIKTLATQAKDWGGWDDTYNYAGGQNPKYIKVNVNEDNLTNLRLNLLIYLDASGAIIHSTGFDYKQKQAMPIPRSFFSHVGDIRALLSRADIKDSISGIVMLPEAPMMVGAHQILKGDYSGPGRGTIIMGRLLNDDEVKRVADATELNVRLFRYDDARLPVDVQAARARLGGGEGVFVSPLDERAVAGYAPINDISGRPALMLRVESPRDIYSQGEHTIRYFLFALLAIAIALGTMVMLLLEKSVLSRLAHLSMSVRKIGVSGEMSARVSVPGKDELARLADSVNGMLSALERSQEDLMRKEALKESEERYRGLVEHSPDAVLICKGGRYVFSNAAGAKLLGAADAGEIIGRPVADSFLPERRDLVEGCVTQAAGGHGLLKVEEKLVRLDGAMVDVELTALPFRYQDEDTVEIILHDITERKRYEDKIIYMAYYDSLTGLPNRLLLYDRLGQAIKAAQRSDNNVAVLFLDLDNFKRINDTLGHTTGDRLLIGVAERLSGILRAGDSVAHLCNEDESGCVSRLGGDEFGLLLAGIPDMNDVAGVAQRVVESMNRPFKLDGHELYVTTSIGITLYPLNGDDPDTLLKNADVAMYKSKDMGRNTYQFYTQSMNETAYDRLVMENNLRIALKREEFLLHYQPQVGILSGKTVGLEALVRWQNKERGMVSPGDFIPIAEENGLIIPIGEWVLRTACSQHAAWREAGLNPVRVAVNLSSYQFRQKGLIETVARALSDHGLDPGCIELELTESVLMQNPAEAVETMRKLKDMGLAITVDDFGTGYSSLSYLKRFPLDCLKIDGSFVRDITTDPDDAAITRTIIAMAHNLNLKVVAEGVEMQAQLEFLRENDCDVAQGYLISRPVPADKIGAFLKA